MGRASSSRRPSFCFYWILDLGLLRELPAAATKDCRTSLTTVSRCGGLQVQDQLLSSWTQMFTAGLNKASGLFLFNTELHSPLCSNKGSQARPTWKKQQGFYSSVTAHRLPLSPPLSLFLSLHFTSTSPSNSLCPLWPSGSSVCRGKPVL